MTDEDKALWKAVTDTVVPLGSPGGKKKPLRVDPIIEPSVIDLHGFTVQDAYEMTLAYLGTTTHAAVIIVTGRSGVIRREFEQWIAKLPVVRSYEMLNDGAFRIFLRKD